MKHVTGLMFFLFVSLAGINTVARAAQSNDSTEVEIGPVAVPENRSYTIGQVRAAIIYGAMGNHWVIESETSGVVRIKLDGRNDHIVLVMDILYDANSYSIKFVSSDVPQQRKLKFNSTYSRWTRVLAAAINRELNLVNL